VFYNENLKIVMDCHVRRALDLVATLLATRSSTSFSLSLDR
jgi:hypothetical protein